MFITCSLGFENLLADELKSLGFKDFKTGFCGVFLFDETIEAACRVLYASRIATRVLLPLRKFSIRNDKDLYRVARDVEWSKFINPETSFAIDPNVSYKAFNNSLYAAQVVKDAICDSVREVFGSRPNVNVKNPAVRLNLFIDKAAKGVLYFDAAGDPLFKRGYREETVVAPMQESLAAALLMIARYCGTEMVVDPCCGSATLLIESAMMTGNIAPGFLKESWGICRHPDFDELIMKKVKQEFDNQRKPLKRGQFLGIDNSKRAVFSASMNIQKAGLQEVIQIERGDFSEFDLQRDYDFMITNAPHGQRLQEASELVGLYRSLGDFMKRKLKKPARGFVYTTNMELSKQVGLATSKRHVIQGSKDEGRLLEYDIY